MVEATHSAALEREHLSMHHLSVLRKKERERERVGWSKTFGACSSPGVRDKAQVSLYVLPSLSCCSHCDALKGGVKRIKQDSKQKGYLLGCGLEGTRTAS